MPKINEVVSIQPRFVVGDQSIGWAGVEQIFRMGENAPPLGSLNRDMYLAHAWLNEPLTANVFGKWIEKAVTIDWKITGGRNQARYYSQMLQSAEGNEGWTAFFAKGALDYLTTDKGTLEEIGRQVDESDWERWRQFTPEYSADVGPTAKYWQFLTDLTQGRPAGLQHLDSTRMVKVGLPEAMWAYYPTFGPSTVMPDFNVIQLRNLPSPQDRLSGFGHSPLSRVLDAKNFMVGLLTYHREQIGNLPPQLMVIINGMSQTAVSDALSRYRMQREQNDMSIYSGSIFLGGKDPLNPVNATIQRINESTAPVDWAVFQEWWVKVLAAAVGEAVGEFWLVQNPGNTGHLQSAQSMKSEGSGVGKFIREYERLINNRVLPFGVKFEFDNANDEADKRRADILASNIQNLKTLSEIGGDNPIFATEELKELALAWEIIPDTWVDEEVPDVVGTAIKELGNLGDDVYRISSNGDEVKVESLLKSDKDKRAAEIVYKHLKTWYGSNHTSTEDNTPYFALELATEQPGLSYGTWQGESYG